MKNGTKRRISAIDVLIVLLLLAAVVGVGFKVFAGNVGLFAGETQEYYVSYVVEGADSQISKYITEGSGFYTEDGTAFGTVTGDVITTPAKIYNMNSNGEYVVSYSSGGEKEDISGTFLVRASETEKGIVCGEKYISAGMRVSLTGNGVSVEILITDVVKASQ